MFDGGVYRFSLPNVDILVMCWPKGMWCCFRVFFFVTCPGIHILLAKGVYRLCIGILQCFLVCSYIVWRLFPDKWLCGTDASGVPPAFLCGNVYFTAVCWRDMNLRMLFFCIVITYDVEYRILKIKQLFVHLFVLLVRAIYTEFLKAIHVYLLSYLYYFHCVPYVSLGVSRVSYVLCVSGCVVYYISLQVHIFCSFFGTIALLTYLL